MQRVRHPHSKRSPCDESHTIAAAPVGVPSSTAPLTPGSAPMTRPRMVRTRQDAGMTNDRHEVAAAIDVNAGRPHEAKDPNRRQDDSDENDHPAQQPEASSADAMLPARTI